MFNEHFIPLFKYNDWATHEAAKSIRGLKKKNEKPEQLLSHIVVAQKLWLNRTLERTILIDPWEKYSVQESVSKSTIITSEWINLLESLEEKDFEKRVDYLNSKGEKFNNSIKDIISHIINHSTYHRAQIAMLVRQAGGEPSKTDYIVYQRQVQK